MFHLRIKNSQTTKKINLPTVGGSILAIINMQFLIIDDNIFSL